jgi:serine-type D-Ala-D-Ala carboxypeptidase/endopeptidase (penicillin-binding protein 4)
MQNLSVFRQLYFLTFAFLIFTSCNLQKQISRSAENDVLNNKTLASAHIGISIYDPETNKYWFNYQGDKYFVPASNTKIPTCYAAMKYLGDSLVGFKYIKGDTTIIILPTGDPTFLHPDFSSVRAINLIKKQRSVSLLTNNFYAHKLGSGWSWNDYQETYMAERSSFPMYGNLVTIYLKEGHVRASPSFFEKMIFTFPKNTSRIPELLFSGMKVLRPLHSNEFLVTNGESKSITLPFSTTESMFSAITMNPSLQTALLSDTLKMTSSSGVFRIPANDLIVFHSQPTDSVLKPMMHRSDNFFAEQSLLMVSNELLGIMNDEKIIDTLLKTDFKDLPQQPRWVDGCGLSRYNLFTPQDFVAILNKMKTEFGMERIKVIFATGGDSTSTISNYYKTESGYIYAKTGTLSGVVALSGFLFTKKNKLLIFSTLVNNHNGSATEVRRAVEKFLQGIRNRY